MSEIRLSPRAGYTDIRIAEQTYHCSGGCDQPIEPGDIYADSDMLICERCLEILEDEEN